MIVPMKKVSLVVLDSCREESLEKLQEIGVLHLEGAAATNEVLTGLGEKKSLIEYALRLLPAKSDPAQPKEKPESVTDPLDIAKRVVDLSEREQSIREEMPRLAKEAEKLSQWGDFDPDSIRDLHLSGIYVRLYTVPEKEIANIPKETKFFVLTETKTTVNIAVVSLGKGGDLPFEEVPVPERGLSEINKLIAGQTDELKDIENELSRLSNERALLEKSTLRLDTQMDFENARAGMGTDGKLAFLTGYTPEKKTADLKKTAAENGWALLLREPEEDDPVPTLIENPKWISIINPAFKLMDVVPGYKEFDISMWFLLFFSVFFALLVGDGGYGIIFLILTLAARRFLKTAPPEPFILMYILSICTIIWGGLTGNWFGCEALSQLWPLKNIIIPALNAYSPHSALTVTHICFVLAAVHLSLAHLVVAFSYINSLKSLARIGWAIVVWALFFVVEYLFFKSPLPSFTIHFLIIGLVMVVLFTSPSKNIFKTLGLGLADVPMKTIDVFKDILSYIRLFAVGMATLAVAQSFNALGMQVGFSKIYLALGASLIIAGGHILNIVLAIMSVAVHGLRLNMLEFSGHIGMEWSGQRYKPFCRGHIED